MAFSKKEKLPVSVFPTSTIQSAHTILINQNIYSPLILRLGFC